MRRYLEIIHGVAMCECETSGALPPRVLYCRHEDEDEDVTLFTWHPQMPRDERGTIEDFLAAHQAHPGFEDRRIVDVTALPSAKLFMEYDPQTGVFTKGAAFAASRPRPRAARLTKFEFMSLLTADERTALRARAGSDAVLADALAMLELAGHVEPAHLLVTAMLDHIEQLGVMTPKRRAAFIQAATALAS